MTTELMREEVPKEDKTSHCKQTSHRNELPMGERFPIRANGLVAPQPHKKQWFGWLSGLVIGCADETSMTYHLSCKLIQSFQG
jgi:hypothetical protein